MYEIKQTVNIKAKKFSIWFGSEELIRSISLLSAKKIIAHLEKDHEKLQRDIKVHDESVFSDSSQERRTSGLTSSSCDPGSHGDQVQPISLPIQESGEVTASSTRSSSTRNDQESAELHKESSLAKLKETFKEFKVGSERGLESSRKSSRRGLENSRRIVERSRRIAAIAICALDAVDTLSSRLGELGDDIGRDFKGAITRKLDYPTLDVPSEEVTEVP